MPAPCHLYTFNLNDFIYLESSDTITKLTLTRFLKKKLLLTQFKTDVPPPIAVCSFYYAMNKRTPSKTKRCAVDWLCFIVLASRSTDNV